MEDDPSISLPYSDVTNPELEQYLKYAYSQGWISNQEHFRPNDPITFGEAKTILVRRDGVTSEKNLFSSETTTISRAT